MSAPWFRRGLVVLALLALGAPAPAEEKPARIAWFRSVRTAREVAQQRGRPLWIALHPRPATGSAAWPYGGPGWTDLYADPAVVRLSRRFVCVHRHVASAPAPSEAKCDARPEAANHFEGPALLVLDSTGKTLLARVDGWSHPAGTKSVEALTAFLTRASARAGGPAPDSREVGPADVRRKEPVIPGSSEVTPVQMGTTAPGFRMRLRWALPLPAIGDHAQLRALVSIYWDGAGPFDLSVVDLPVGAEVDVPVDVRYADFPVLKPLATKGRHRVDVYVEPVEGGVPFSSGPIHIGRVWIELGDGGGGGGSGATEQEQEAQPEEPEDSGDEHEPEPPEPTEPPEPPPPGDDHVVEPFIREGETVDKEDAIVGAKADDAGVKPPPPGPSATPPRDFRKQLEESINWERIPLEERAFLRRYFDAMDRALKRAAKKRAGAPK